MSASFKLTLDTAAHVAAAINGGKPTTEVETVTLGLDGDADLIEMKVWGDINVLDPLAPGLSETEEGAEWQAFEPTLLLNLSQNPGPKTLHVRVKDDVWNEAVATASIVLGEEVAPPPTPKPPGWPTPPRRRPERRQPTRKRTRSSTTVTVSSSSRSRVRLREEVDVHEPRTNYLGGLGSRRVSGPLNVRTTVAVMAAVGHSADIAVAPPRHDRDIEAAIGPKMQAALEALDII